MIQLSSVLLLLVLLAVIAYALYWIVRKAVAHGIRDAQCSAAEVLREP